MRTTLAVCLLAAGCGCGDSRQKLLCECFANAAYEAVRAESLEAERPEECCGKCNGTGKVRSGDGLAIVPCPCPDSCPCKSKGKK